VIRYRTFHHTADLGIDIYGRTVDALFVHAAEAILELLTDPKAVCGEKTVLLRVEGIDGPDLLVNFLREILDQLYGNRLLFKKIRILHRSENTLCAEARGESLNPAKHRLRREIKAVTHHQASLIREKSGRWHARVILDV